MAYCPDCRGEYRAGITRCSECGTDLVDDLPPEPETIWDPVEWVTVDESGDEANARILEGFLVEGGLPVRVVGDQDRTFPAPDGGLSRVEVQVPAEDLNRAISLLEALDEVDGPDPGEGAPD